MNELASRTAQQPNQENNNEYRGIIGSRISSGAGDGSGKGWANRGSSSSTSDRGNSTRLQYTNTFLCWVINLSSATNQLPIVYLRRPTEADAAE